MYQRAPFADIASSSACGSEGNSGVAFAARNDVDLNHTIGFEEVFLTFSEERP